MVGEQMTLFEESESEWNNESDKSKFSEWSYSRRNLLDQCPRKYYYERYGSNLQTAKNDPQKEKLRFLEVLQNRYLRTGEILHFVVKAYLNKIRQGEQWSLDRLLNWARKIYHADLEYSRNYEHGTPLPDEQYPPALLLEFYYGWSDAESVCIEAGKRLIEALANFVKSQNLAQFREGASRPAALIEKTIYFKTVHFIFRGAVDLAYCEDDKLVIIDWKIGSASSSDDSLQMLAYAWWVKEEFKHLPDYITPYRVHLVDDTVLPFTVSAKSLTQVEARILQDLERMREADKYGRRGVVEAFTPCAQLKVCEMCQFQEICPKE